MKILVTGGAGYIGSFITKRLLDDGHDVLIVDSLERGHAEALDNRAQFIQGSLLDKSFLLKVFSEHNLDAVFHFAAYISMAESMEKPSMYFTNNLIATLNLLDAMVEHNVNKIIFSSTAGVYGNPQRIPIPEDHPKNPENPYGESKLMVERVLHWYQKINNIRFVVLRYFNASGAALDGTMGEDHKPESHIIPNAIKALLEGRSFTLFGNDYDTPDGTCVRDYIHVLDLAEAHVLGLQKIAEHDGGYTYNVGTGHGYSNKEIMDMVEKVSGRKLDVQMEGRRPGDAGELVADPTRIKEDLGFEPKYSDLETIISSAWKWHSKRV